MKHDFDCIPHLPRRRNAVRKRNREKKKDRIWKIVKIRRVTLKLFIRWSSKRFYFDKEYLKALTYLLGLVLGRSGAPVFSLALGYCERYVIMDCSSILGLTISSGLISCRTLSQSSASPIASDAFSTASFGSHNSQSGHRPGAQASTRAPTALPLVQSVVKLPIGTSGIFVWIQFRSLGIG